MSKRGKFIAIEGVDGSGKSTLLDGLQRALPGDDIVWSREPGGTPLGEELRAILHHKSDMMEVRTQMLLFFASRAEHIAKLIAPALASGKNVICDRFSASTFAYQLYAQDHLNERKNFKFLEEWIVGVMEPDLYLFLNLPTEIAMERMREGRSPGDLSAFDKGKEEFHRRVRAGYGEFFRGKRNVVTIDAGKSPEAVLAATLAALKNPAIR